MRHRRLKATQLGLMWNQWDGTWTFIEGGFKTTGTAITPKIRASLGFQSTFDLKLRFSIANNTMLGNGGILIIGVNSGPKIDGWPVPFGLSARIGVSNSGFHKIVGPDGERESKQQVILQAGIPYFVRFAFDGRILRLKIWRTDEAEPGWLLELPTQNSLGTDIFFAMDLDSGETNSLAIDQIELKPVVKAPPEEQKAPIAVVPEVPAEVLPVERVEVVEERPFPIGAVIGIGVGVAALILFLMRKK